jgi:hypothetical protein
MKCPFIEGETIKKCRAVDCAVALGGCELNNFCLLDKHNSCPVFQEKIKITGVKLSLAQYYAIYSDWVRKDVSRVVA